MEIINNKDLPEGDHVVIVGWNTSVESGNKERVCTTCEGPVYISAKNADKKVRFMCNICALKIKDAKIMTSKEDLDAAMDARGITGMDREAFANMTEATYNRLRKKGEWSK